MKNCLFTRLILWSNFLTWIIFRWSTPKKRKKHAKLKRQFSSAISEETSPVFVYIFNLSLPAVTFELIKQRSERVGIGTKTLMCPIPMEFFSLFSTKLYCFGQTGNSTENSILHARKTVLVHFSPLHDWKCTKWKLHPFHLLITERKHKWNNFH